MKRTDDVATTRVSKQGSNYKLEENSFSMEFERSSSNRAVGTPIKMLIDQEMAKERKARQPSPNLVARLMGLDVLPVIHAGDREKETGSNYQKPLSTRRHGNLVSYEGQPPRMAIDKCQDFKDVHEIAEKHRADKKKGQSARKEKMKPSGHEVDMNFIREKFMDAKRLSTDELLRKSKEFDDALDALDSNKELFLKFLQEPNSLFSKHLQSLKFPSLPHTSDTRFSSHYAEHERSDKGHKRKCYSEAHALHKPGHSSRQHRPSFFHASTNLNHKGEGNTSLHPTHIVVLTPNKTQNMKGDVTLPGFSGDFSFGCEVNNRFLSLGIQELPIQPIGRLISVEGKGGCHRKNGSRESSRGIADSMRNSASSNAKKLSLLDKINRRREKLSMSENIASKYTGNDDMSSLFSYPTETSVSREARKHLSKRSKMARRLREAGISRPDSSTLSEMFALSDMEMLRPTLAQFIAEDSNEELAKVVVPNSTLHHNYGNISRHGCKEKRRIKLSRSVSLPASSVSAALKFDIKSETGSPSNFYTNKDALSFGFRDYYEDRYGKRGVSHNSARNKLWNQQFNVTDGEIIEREIHVASEKLKEVTHVRRRISEVPKVSATPKSTIHCTGDLVDNSLISEAKDSLASSHLRSLPSSPVLECDVQPSSHAQTKIFEEDISSSDPLSEPFLFGHHSTGPEPPTCLKEEVEQPSPVSVLDPPDEEFCNSDCFEGVSEGLKELRRQLRLLKLETSDECAEDEATACSDDDGDDRDLQGFGNDEDDREYSYVVDVLAGLGGMNHRHFSDACRLQEDDQLCLELFDELEKRYNTAGSWERPERKLLFDLIRATLAEVVVAPQGEPKPGVKLVASPPAAKWSSEDIWHAIVRCRRSSDPDTSVELERFDADDNRIYCVGSDLGAALEANLLEELASELVAG